MGFDLCGIFNKKPKLTEAEKLEIAERDKQSHELNENNQMLKYQILFFANKFLKTIRSCTYDTALDVKARPKLSGKFYYNFGFSNEANEAVIVQYQDKLSAVGIETTLTQFGDGIGKYPTTILLFNDKLEVLLSKFQKLAEEKTSAPVKVEESAQSSAPRP